MSSEDTAYSPDTSPKRRDWADINHDDKGQYGVGPGLKDPNDPIQNSERANETTRRKQQMQLVRDHPFEGLPTTRPNTNISNTETMLEAQNQKITTLRMPQLLRQTTR
jgi:hypothetical protein